MLVGLFDNGIRYTHEIRQIDPALIEGLKYPKDMYLSSVGLLEEGICELRDRLMNTYEKAIIPLIAYCHEYDKFTDLFNQNNTEYVL